MDDGSTRILVGDCRTQLLTLPEASVHCCVTSPPYWRLRDYGTATWEGGDSGCDHKEQTRSIETQVASSTLLGSKATVGHAREPLCGSGGQPCKRCGAQRVDYQTGLESTPEAFVASLVEVFAAVRRVLRDDATLWLNLGDSYAGSRCGEQGATGQMNDRSVAAARCRVRSNDVDAGLPPKNLVGIPWRVAFALQADGWYLRSDIIWSKPNPLPESVTDRPTKAHEYLFLLSKSERYFYDAAAVAETAVYGDHARNGTPDGNVHAPGQSKQRGISRRRTKGASAEPPKTRNRRSVWTVGTDPYSEAHFAVMPRKIAETCILAGSPVGGTVLDPFAGAGTTLLVAREHGRRGIGCELSAKYAAMAWERTRQCVMFGPGPPGPIGQSEATETTETVETEEQAP